jgi:hypothetical protein
MGMVNTHRAGLFPGVQSEPAVLAAPGLVIFGITALVLNVNLFNADIVFPAAGTLVPLTLCGGLGQLAVAARDWSRKNLFSATVFASYGLFCLSLIPLVILPRSGQAAPESQALAAYLAIWGMFSIVLFRAFSKKSRSMRQLFGFLTIFLALAAAGASTQNFIMQTAAGYAGIMFGIDAVMVGLARKRNG